ncbi:MAG TPA: Wzz/FepE/Etk N-terminal domain-containing protein [Candidatus Angelobacter sp.]|nr:Wzz/FepE/Etk N-terminal domain-containing protein [Candidatus Angelobacter sp.]
MTQTADLNEPVTPETSESPDDVSLLDLLIVLGKRKKFLAVSTLVVGAVALIVSLLIPKRFTANTTVLPPQQGSSLSAALLSQVGNLGTLGSLAGGSLGLKNPADMTIALLKSRSVEDAMIRRFDLMKLYKEKRISDARKAFEDHCSIDSNLKDGIIRIVIEDRDPQRASDMANAYVDEYRKFSARLAITEAGQRRLFFEQQLVEAKNNLAGAEEALKASQQKSGMIQLDSQAKALIESVAALRAQIAAKEVQIRSLSLSETPTNPDILMAREQLATLQSQLRQIGGTQSVEDSDLIVPRGKIPEAGMDYVRKLRDVKYNELIFELLAKQFELAKLDEAREGAIIQVVDPAVPPDRKSFPKISLVVPGVTFVWALFAIFGILFLEGIRRASQRPEDYSRLQAFKAIWRRDDHTS